MGLNFHNNSAGCYHILGQFLGMKCMASDSTNLLILRSDNCNFPKDNLFMVELYHNVPKKIDFVIL